MPPIAAPIIRTRCEVMQARRRNDLWHVTTTDRRNGASETIAARALVNAAGPWVGVVKGRLPVTGDNADTRLVRGSHIVVPRIFDHDRSYILQNDDKRIVFVIPYEGGTR